MGYPMSYQRVLNRNRLHDGSYDTEPVDWFAPGTAVAWSVVDDGNYENVLAFAQGMAESYNGAAKRYNAKVRLLMGDLRRLEADTVDEGAICQRIVADTGLSLDDVAAVLKLWMGV